MIIAAFDKEEKIRVKGLTQWDYGQILRIQGISLPPAVEIHFSLQDTGGESVTRIGVTKDGSTDVPIPDSMLENDGTDQDYAIFAWTYIADRKEGESTRKITLPVMARPKPETMENPEDQELFREAIETVKESAETAEKCVKEAEAWAHGHEEYKDREKDNAKYYANIAKDEAMRATGAALEAKKEIDEYVAGKEKELKGETGNVYFAAFKVKEGRLKMYSDPKVDKVRFRRCGSRLKYRLEV